MTSLSNKQEVTVTTALRTAAEAYRRFATHAEAEGMPLMGAQFRTQAQEAEDLSLIVEAVGLAWQEAEDDGPFGYGSPEITSAD